MDAHTSFVVSEILRYNRLLQERVALNRQILENPYWFLPIEKDEGHKAFEPVGRGVKSSEFCAKWMHLLVCKNFEGHRVYGERKVVVKHRHMWCHRPTCPVCFIRGWSVRGAHSITGRVDKGVQKGFGVVEHITVSVPPEDYGLDEKALREKCRLVLLDRGVFGGCMIFHGYRIAKGGGKLVWSPHYHTIGFVMGGGFDRCRRCLQSCLHQQGDCDDCSGFWGREFRGQRKDRYIVKVFAVRKTVYGTAWYQLHHATVRVSAFSRFHVVTWFGLCGNRKYGSGKVLSEDVCPVCGEDMVRCRCASKRRIVKDIGNPDYVPWFVDDELDDKGEPNYPEVVGSSNDG